jgi:HEAT repeat protein
MYMNVRPTIFGCAIAGLLGGVIVWVMLPPCAFNNASTQAGRDACSLPQRPKRESIPDDAPAKIRKLMENLLSANDKDRTEAIIDTRRLGQDATPLVPYLIENLNNARTASVRELADRALYDLGELAVVPLVHALGVKEYKGQARMRILSLLGLIADRRAIPALIAALDDEDQDVRWHAARALVDIPDQRAVEPLMRCLHDKNDRVVSVAVWALGKTGDRRAVKPIIELLVGSRKLGQGSVGVRRNAAKALGELGDRRAFDALLAAYRDTEYPNKEYPDRLLRENALTALGHTKDPRAFEVLRQALVKNKDATDYERRAAVWGLAGLGDERSILLLKPILVDERPVEKWWKTESGRVSWVRAETARALVATGNAGAIAAVWNEYKHGPKVSEGIDEIDIDRHFRLAAVDALAMSPKPRAYLKVTDVLEGTDTQMRCEAARVVCSSALSQMLSETDVAANERRRLPALDDMRVLRALMKVAGSVPPSKDAGGRALKTFRETQEYAIAALRKSGNPEALTFVERRDKRGHP